MTIHGHAGQGLAENIMSGVVRVTGNASQAAGASGHGGLVVIEGDASSRCGISMKGVDIVVQRLGRPHERVHGAGRPSRGCGDAGPDLGDSLYEAVLYVRGKVASLGADCIEKPMTEAASRRRSRGCSSGPASISIPPPSAATARRAGSTTSTSTMPAAIEVSRSEAAWHRPARPQGVRELPASVIAEIQRAAREGLYEIRGFGAKRRLPTFDDLVLLGASVSRYPLEGYREKCATNVTIGTRFAEQADRARDPDHDRRHELRRARRARQGGARPRRDRRWAPARRPATAA